MSDPIANGLLAFIACQIFWLNIQIAWILKTLARPHLSTPEK